MKGAFSLNNPLVGTVRPPDSKPIFGHSAGRSKLDRPYCKRFWDALGVLVRRAELVQNERNRQFLVNLFLTKLVRISGFPSLFLRPRWPGTSVKTAKMPRSAKGRVLKVFSGLRSQSPKKVSRTVQTLFLTGQNTPKHTFAPCKRLFWDSRSGGPKTPFALSLKHFWAFWLFWHLYQATGVATLFLAIAVLSAHFAREC